MPCRRHLRISRLITILYLHHVVDRRLDSFAFLGWLGLTSGFHVGVLNTGETFLLLGYLIEHRQNYCSSNNHSQLCLSTSKAMNYQSNTYVFFCHLLERVLLSELQLLGLGPLLCVDLLL